jgi:hypothetical protein
MAVQPLTKPEADLSEQAMQLYRRIRSKVETPDNIGKMMIVDVDSGDYEIGDDMIEPSHCLQARHPGSILFGIRIGYKTVASIGGTMERIDP